MKTKWICLAMLGLGIFHLLSLIAAAGEIKLATQRVGHKLSAESESYRTPVTPDNTVYGGKPHAGAFTCFFGGENGIKYPLQHIRVHTMTRVADR